MKATLAGPSELGYEYLSTQKPRLWLDWHSEELPWAKLRPYSLLTIFLKMSNLRRVFRIYLNMTWEMNSSPFLHLRFSSNTCYYLLSFFLDFLWRHLWCFFFFSSCIIVYLHFILLYSRTNLPNICWGLLELGMATLVCLVAVNPPVRTSEAGRVLLGVNDLSRYGF